MLLEVLVFKGVVVAGKFILAKGASALIAGKGIVGAITVAGQTAVLAGVASTAVGLVSSLASLAIDIREGRIATAVPKAAKLLLSIKGINGIDSVIENLTNFVNEGGQNPQTNSKLLNIASKEVAKAGFGSLEKAVSENEKKKLEENVITALKNSDENRSSQPINSQPTAPAAPEESVKKRVKKILSKASGKSAKKIKKNDLLFDDLILDDFDLDDLKKPLRKEFGVKIKKSKIRDCYTVKDVIKLVDKYY